MKKSILPLLAGLVGLAGVTSASAATDYSYASAFTKKGTYADNSTTPLYANNNGDALLYREDSDSGDWTLFFSDRYAKENVGNRLASLAFWDYGSSDRSSTAKGGLYKEESSEWKHCPNTACANSNSYMIKNISYKSAGGTSNMNIYIPSSDVNDLLSQGFKGSDIVHVAIRNLQYTVNGSYVNRYGAGVFNKAEGTIAMYFVDFFRPIQSTVVLSKVNSTDLSTSEMLAKTQTVHYTDALTFTYAGHGSDGAGKQTVTYIAEAQNMGSNAVLQTRQNPVVLASYDYTPSNGTAMGTSQSNALPSSVVNATTDNVIVSVKAKQPFARLASGTYVRDTTTVSTNKVTLNLTHPFIIKKALDFEKMTESAAIGTVKVTKSSYTELPVSTLPAAGTSKNMRLGKSVTLQAVPTDGYKFFGWSAGDKIISSNSELNVVFTRDTTIQPVFKEIETKVDAYFSNNLMAATIASDKNSVNFVYSNSQVDILGNFSGNGTVSYRLQYMAKGQSSWTTLTNYGDATTVKSNLNSACDNVVATIATILNTGSLNDASGRTLGIKLPTNVEYVDIRVSAKRTNGSTIDTSEEIIRVYWFYPVKFLNKDKTVLSKYSKNVAYSGNVSIPTRTDAGISASANGYNFDYYWLEEDGSTKLFSSETSVNNVTRAMTFTAYETVKYNVTFYDFDATVLKATVSYASTETVVSPSSPDHNGNTTDYQFFGWNTDKNAKNKLTINKVSAPTEYYAIYKNRVTFINGEDAKTDYYFNSDAAIAPEVSEKDGYTFVGWYVEGDADETIVTDFTVTEPVTYVARFAKNPEFQLAFEGFAGHGKAGDAKLTSENPCIKVEEPVINLNGETVYKSDVFENGSEYVVAAIVIASVDGECAEDDLVKEVAEAYEFSEKSVPVSVTVDGEKWNVEGLYNVDGVYAFNTKATVTPAIRYLVEFMSTEGEGATVISSALYADGAEIIMPTEEELKNVVVPAADDEFGYAFNNKWSPEVAATVTADVQYVPVIDKSSQTYVVTFHVGEETSESDPVKYGESVTLPAIPSKEGFLFMGWNTVEGKKSGFYNSEAIKGNTDLYAVFTEIPEVKFVATDMIEGNDFITITSPSKCFVVENEVIAGVNSKNPMAAGKEYTWTAALTPDEENCSEDDELLVALRYAYTAIITNKLNVKIPVMVNDQVAAEDLTAALSGEANTITYKFTAAAIDLYTITFLQADGKTEISSDKIKGGEKIVAPAADKVTAPMDDAQYKYVFKGWDPALADDATATEDASYTAQFEKVLQTYSVKFLADGKQVGETQTVSYGKAATAPKDPTKEGYKFTKWDTEDYKNVKGDVEVNAVFEKITSSSSSKVEDKSSSSSKPASSSSKVEDKSSSSAKPASSSSKTEDKSSSSAKPASSSSKTEAIFAAAQAPKFSLSVAGRNVQIAGARVGSAYAILDMQGRVMTTGSVESANFSVALPRSGSYMVRVGSQAQRVNVR